MFGQTWDFCPLLSLKPQQTSQVLSKKMARPIFIISLLNGIENEFKAFIQMMNARQSISEIFHIEMD